MRLFIFCIILVYCGKTDAAKKYKSEKINYIHDKAQNHIEDQSRLGRLESDLKKYDDLYIDTKHEYAHSDSKILTKELAKIDKKLIDLLERHGLQHTVQSFKEKVKHKDEYKHGDNFNPQEVKFEDERLNTLWNSAVENSFSTYEMKELYAELKDAERLMEEHHDAKQSLNKVPMENDVHFDHEEDVRNIAEKEKRLKETHKRLDSHLENVEKRVKGEHMSKFKSEKVKKMWKLASANTKFSESDLRTLEEELHHFDKQIEKFDESTRRESINSKDGGENAEMLEKQDNMKKKMQKLEKYLQTKVQHEEL